MWKVSHSITILKILCHLVHIPGKVCFSCLILKKTGQNIPFQKKLVHIVLTPGNIGHRRLIIEKTGHIKTIILKKVGHILHIPQKVGHIGLNFGMIGQKIGQILSLIHTIKTIGPKGIMRKKLDQKIIMNNLGHNSIILKKECLTGPMKKVGHKKLGQNMNIMLNPAQNSIIMKKIGQDHQRHKLGHRVLQLLAREGAEGAKLGVDEVKGEGEEQREKVEAGVEENDEKTEIYNGKNCCKKRMLMIVVT